jgi:hypothetical protein
MRDAELKTYLFADRLEQAELEQVILAHFGNAKSEGKHTTYLRDGSDTWLRVEYTKEHAIRGFTRSANYPESDIKALRDRIRAELVDGQETKVAQVICFAYNEVTGCARGCIRGIEFQVMPLPPGNATVGFAYGRHPFMLEATYHTSSNFIIRGTRVQRSAIPVARFLNLLVASPIEMLPRSTDYAWVVESQESDGEVDTKNRYMQIGYFPVGLSVSIDEFSDASGVSPMSRVPADEYYSFHGIALGNPLSLPDTLDESLKIASQLPTGSYNKLFTALTFFAMSHGVWHESRSASYVRERKALQDAFYELRSGLAHGAKVLQSDLEPWKFHDRRGQVEDDLHRRLQEVVRNALLNWLLSHNSLHKIGKS